MGDASFSRGHRDPTTLPKHIHDEWPIIVGGYATSAYLAGVEVGRAVAAEEIAQAIHDRFDHKLPEWHEAQLATAKWCEDEARRHAAPVGRTPDGGDHG